MPVALSLGRSELLRKCIEVYETFDPKRTTVDAYVEDAPALKDRSVGMVEQKFIHQVFYGCVRYQKFLKLFVTSFLYKSPAVAIRSEQTLYMVLAYLMFFRLEELGVHEFRLLLNCGLGTVSGLLAMLQYALSVEELEKWVKLEWCKVYDLDYIEKEVIGKLQGFAEDLRPALEEVEFKATGTVKAGDTATLKPTEKRRTEPQPFNLTQPKPRLIPEPEVISRQVKAQPVPAAVHKGSLATVEEEKKKRLAEEKAKVAAKYSPRQHFNLAARRDGSELEELTRKVDAERMAECTFKPKPHKPFVPPTEEAPVRQNAAAVLREDALLKQKQAKEYGILKRYEEDLHDASEFHRWQEEMKQRDHQEEQQRVQQRMVEMQLAREGAIEATESEVRKKNILAAHHREELKVQLEQKEIENEFDMQGKQKLVQETQQDRQNARVAAEDAARARAEHAEQIRKEKEAEAEKKRREDEQEMERRKDLIREIRALEKVPVERFKMFDPAEPPRQGLLEEMSLAELRERLKMSQARHAKEVDERRERQLEKKLEKQHELAEKAETLAKIRERAKEETQQRHAAVKKKQQEVEAQQQQYREQCILEVAEKIQQKKQQKHEQELKLKRELKEISTKREFLAANADMVEAKAHGEQHASVEREARERQKGLLVDQRKQNAIHAKDTKLRRDNQRKDVDEYKVMQEAVDDRVRRAKAADVALKEGIRQITQSARASQKTLERKLAAEVGHSSNRYMQKMTTRMATSA